MCNAIIRIRIGKRKTCTIQNSMMIKRIFFCKRAWSTFKMTQWVVVTRNGPKPNSSRCIGQPTLQTALLLSFGLSCCCAQSAHPHARPKTHANKNLSTAKISFEMEWHVGAVSHTSRSWSRGDGPLDGRLASPQNRRKMGDCRWLGGSSTLKKHKQRESGSHSYALVLLLDIELGWRVTLVKRK